jgi:hypothetical protein
MKDYKDAMGSCILGVIAWTVYSVVCMGSYFLLSRLSKETIGWDRGELGDRIFFIAFIGLFLVIAYIGCKVTEGGTLLHFIGFSLIPFVNTIFWVMWFGTGAITLLLFLISTVQIMFHKGE